MYYSKTTNGFYISPTTKNPDDLVEISDALYSKVFDDQAKGMVIVAGDDGLPTTIDRVDERTDDEKRADNIAQLKSQAKLTELDEVKKQGYDDMTELLLFSGQGDTKAGLTTTALASAINIVKKELEKSALPEKDDLMGRIKAEFDGL